MPLDNTIVSVKVNISIYCYSAVIRIYLLLDKEIDRKIDVTAILFLLVQNRHQTHVWTLIGLGADGLGIQECELHSLFFCFIIVLKYKNSIYQKDYINPWKFSIVGDCFHKSVVFRCKPPLRWINRIEQICLMSRNLFP